MVIIQQVGHCRVSGGLIETFHWILPCNTQSQYFITINPASAGVYRLVLGAGLTTMGQIPPFRFTSQPAQYHFPLNFIQHPCYYIACVESRLKSEWEPCNTISINSLFAKNIIYYSEGFFPWFESHDGS